MICQYTTSGCSYPQGECSGACMTDQGRESQRLIRDHLASQQSKALRLADALDAVNTNNADSLLVQMAARSAAAELRRLYEENVQMREQRDELLEALKRIAMACRASARNVGWAAQHARSAIAKAEGEKS